MCPRLERVQKKIMCTKWVQKPISDTKIKQFENISISLSDSSKATYFKNVSTPALVVLQHSDFLLQMFGL